MVTTAEISDVNGIEWTASQVIQNQLAERPNAELRRLLQLWSQSNEQQDAAGLSLAIEFFLNQLLQSLAGWQSDDVQSTDFALVKKAAQGTDTDDEVSERGWDSDDACAELTAMVEEVRLYQTSSNLLVDRSTPVMELRRSHSNLDEIIDIISPMGFLDSLEDFLVSLADTKTSFGRFRTA
ncbi:MULTISPECIES: hypothetical protein [unclassified Rhizobium]|uniref:hypothetical protein n=1 Tax=unclassified Rhizobium TaxID=2613769 RepID=UPI000A4F8900|nr:MULTISPECIES: hypothetical protein [unclassified Rhizobium]